MNEAFILFGTALFEMLYQSFFVFNLFDILKNYFSIVILLFLFVGPKPKYLSQMGQVFN